MISLLVIKQDYIVRLDFIITGDIWYIYNLIFIDYANNRLREYVI